MLLWMLVLGNNLYLCSIVENVLLLPSWASVFRWGFPCIARWWWWRWHHARYAFLRLVMNGRCWRVRVFGNNGLQWTKLSLFHINVIARMYSSVFLLVIINLLHGRLLFYISLSFIVYSFILVHTYLSLLYPIVCLVDLHSLHACHKTEEWWCITLAPLIVYSIIIYLPSGPRKNGWQASRNSSVCPIYLNSTLFCCSLIFPKPSFIFLIFHSPSLYYLILHLFISYLPIAVFLLLYLPFAVPQW